MKPTGAQSVAAARQSQSLTETRTIRVRAGVGDGPTTLAAFDAALSAAGVENFNLIRLSSVIPTGCVVAIEPDPTPLPGAWGDRMHAVWAEERIETPHEEAWAGIGWVQDEHGAGLFVEHHGHSRTQVDQDIRSTLDALVERRAPRGFGPDDVGPAETVIQGITCQDRPVCSLVIAAYETSGWHHLMTTPDRP